MSENTFVWKKVESTEDLPKDQVFLALWKGIISLCEYDEDEDCFYISHYPNQYEVMKVAKDREYKFTHHMLLKLPDDY